MENWSGNLFTALNAAHSEEEVFRCVSNAAREIGFDHCAYGMRLPVPVTNPRVIIINNYPCSWKHRYQQKNYIQVDPTVQHGMRSQTALVWSDEVFASARELWEDAQSFGLRVGWLQSTFDSRGSVGMLTLSRSGTALAQSELTANEPKMRLLADAAHAALSRAILPRVDIGPESPLTIREVEILKWIADGKTSREAALILAISMETVNWHVKNAIQKLRSSNKTAAVVRAAMLGLLN